MRWCELQPSLEILRTLCFAQMAEPAQDKLHPESSEAPGCKSTDTPMNAPLTLEEVCEALNGGGDIAPFPPETDWWELAREYAKRFDGPQKWIEHVSVEVMYPAICGQFLAVVQEVRT